MKPNTLLVTGGHPTPAIACIDYIRSVDSEVRIVFVGRRYINSKEKNDTLEYQEIATNRGITFFHSVAKRGANGLVNIFQSINQAFEIFNDTKPDKILSFGGYISFPICIAALLKGIPYYLHEQTSKPGNANRMLAVFATKIFVSFEMTKTEFHLFPWRQNKLFYTGNPLRNEMYEKQAKPAILEDVTGPVLFVNGGNMGSHAINEHVFKIASQLLLNMNIVHQVGNVDEFADWDIAESIRKDSLAVNTKNKYKPVRHLASRDMAAMIQHADLILCRAGANTFFELIAMKKPAIIVPLPYSARDEQEDQAQILADYGVAEIFDQAQLSSVLYDRIMAVLRSLSTHEKSYEKLAGYTKRDAAKDIWEHVKS